MKAKGKLLKQAASILLCLAMVLGCLPAAVSAAEGTCTESGCGGSYDNGFCSLCGGYEAPELVGARYEIANAGQLYWFADRVNNGEITINGVLVKDITVNESVLDAKGKPVNTSSLRPWTPIGKGGEDGDFYGDFDGDGYVIRGLYCVTSKNDAVVSTGLFGVLHSSTVRDLLIQDSYFEGAGVGAFASWAIDSSIVNCHSSATVKGYENAGGIVANATASIILNSGSIGRTIIANPRDGALGGVLGRSMMMTGDRFASVFRCYYNGTLEREDAGNLALNFVGALVGNIQFVALSESYYLDTLGDAIGSTETIYDDTDYSFDEGTVLPKTRSEFANGTVCELMGFHPGIDNPRMDTEEACLLCPETSKIHIPVEQIDGEVLLNIAPGSYTLPGRVLPANASCKEILWTVLSGPATVSGSVLNATAPGTIELQATVKNGGVGRQDFLRSYTIQCTEGRAFDISGGSVIIEKHNDTQWKITYGWVVTGTETFIQNADQPVWITGETQQHSITVKSGATPTIGLRDCSILAGDNEAGLGIEPGGAVVLQLNGENVLASSANAGIAVPEGAELTITGNGSLLARTDYMGNAAIGGTVDSVNCGTVNIYSGTVTAESDGGGAPIGGGKGNEVTGGHGGSITIYGGTVTAISKGYSAGIGGGQSGGAGRIEIHGGTVTVRNTDPNYEGACIGTGWASSGGSVTITGGTVVASNAGKITGPGIGGDDVAVTISGGTVSAEVNSNYGDTPLQGTVVITGGNVKATAATAPTDGKGTPLSLHTLTVMGASEDSIMEALEGVTYGLKDVKLLDGNKLYCYLPENTRIPSVTLDGKLIPDAEGDLIFCDHSFVWAVFKESTCTEEGIEVFQCEICGYHKEVYETILAPGPYPESDHPRKSELDDTQRYFLPGAKSMTVTFSKETEVFHNFDFIYIYDANGKQIGENYTGDELSGMTIEITGNAFSVRLKSHKNGSSYYGYSIESVYAEAPADAEHVDRLPLAEHTYQDGICSVCGKVEHAHNWTYTKSDNTITATCNGENCPDTNGGSVSIVAPDSLTYTGSEIEAVVDNKLVTDATVAVVYIGEGLVEGKPVKPGTYTASITLGDVTVSVEYTITECPHDSFTNGDCDYCDFVCTHDSSSDYINGFCENGCYEPAKLNGDIYEIGNAGQLFWFARLVNDGTTDADAALTDHITVPEAMAWTPIGTDSVRYAGTFDGSSFAVNFGSRTVTHNGYGLIGYLSGGTVQDVTVKGSFTVDAPVNGIGGVSGWNDGTSYITNCRSYVNISLTENATAPAGTELSGDNSAMKIGGIAGGTEGAGIIYIDRCANYGSIRADGAHECIAGILGYAQKGKLTNCANYGDISADTAQYVAGILGYVNYWEYAGVQNCLNTGSISGRISTGDIVGSLRKHAMDSVKNNYYTGSLGFGEVNADGLGRNPEATAVTAHRLSSGEVAYLLQGEQTEQVWGQTIGTELIPVPGGEKVYKVLNCDGKTHIYSNTDENKTHTPNADDGDCTTEVTCSVCGEVAIPGNAEHSWQDATCTAPKTCSVCNTTEGEASGHTDNDNNGYCDICTERLSPAILHGRSLSLNGDIAINFYMDLSEEVLADENAYMEFRKEDGTVIQVPLAEGTKKLRNTEDYYVFTIPMTSKEMADVVEAQFFWSEGSTEEYTYSVKTYVDNKLPTCEDEALKDLLTAMLHYGAAAQTFFGYHTDRLANEGLEAPDYSGVNIEGFEATKGQATKLLRFSGASLQLNSTTALRFVFLADPDLQEITATCNGETVKWAREGAVISVIVGDISAESLDEFITLTVSDGTDSIEVSYSPMTYCQNIQNSNKDIHTPELKTLMDALYVYNQTANAHFGNNG